MLKKYTLILLLFVSALCYGEAINENEIAREENPVRVALLADHTHIARGQSLTLLLEVELAPNWHVYWKNPGEAGMAPTLDWKLPAGVFVKDIEWPTPERFEMPEAVTFGYSESAPFLIHLQVDEAFATEELPIEGTLQWVACSNDTCLPGISEFKTVVKIGTIPERNVELDERFKKVRSEAPRKLLAAEITRDADLVHFLLPDREIAMGEKPLFFPETGVFGGGAAIRYEGGRAEIALEGKEALKGVLVIGDKSYDIDLPKLSSGELSDLESDLANDLAMINPENLNLAWALLFAFAGGLLLNLMPCVLPVISLKVMNFMQMAGESRRELVKHSALFTSGVLLSFWALAALLMILQLSGQAVGWGFQLQEPFFIACLALLFGLISFNLFGVFEMGMSLSSYAGEVVQQKGSKGYAASLWGGIFATAVATPCTGPFMGSALGYALTQPPYVSLAIFTFLGLGMSLPYQLLGAFPKLIRWLPKPGAWMETFKQFLGFLMLATVIWLLWVFAGQTSQNGLFFLLFALLILSFGAWIYGRFTAPYRSHKMRMVGCFLAALALFSAVGLSHVAAKKSEGVEIQQMDAAWEPFSLKRLKELQAKNIPVFIDFTAKWCLICQANHLVLSQKSVQQKFDEKGVIRMKADWTRHDPEITAELKKHGRSGVPLYLLYSGEGETAPKILSQVLTPENVRRALDNLPAMPKHVR